MRRTFGIAAVLALAAGGLTAGAAFATQPYGNEYLDGTISNPYVEDGHKVTICHRTGSASNPYVIITVDVAAINGDEESDHDHHFQVGNGPIGDVIPPVAGYNDDGFHWNGNWAPGETPTEEDCLGGS